MRESILGPLVLVITLVLILATRSILGWTFFLLFPVNMSFTFLLHLLLLVHHHLVIVTRLSVGRSLNKWDREFGMNAKIFTRLSPFVLRSSLSFDQPTCATKTCAKESSAYATFVVNQRGPSHEIGAAVVFDEIDCTSSRCAEQVMGRTLVLASHQQQQHSHHIKFPLLSSLNKPCLCYFN